MVVRAHFGPIPVPTERAEISIDDPQFSLDARAWHAPHSRRQRSRTTSQIVECQRLAHLFDRSPSSAGGTHWNPERASHRGAPLHPGADQASRNLRRSGRHRDRERAAVPRTQGIVGAADGDERDSWRHRQFADGYPAGAGRDCGKRRAAVRCGRRVRFDIVEGDRSSSGGIHYGSIPLC